MSKLVSIILPTYNGEKYIKKAIESIISQSYTNWELIIVNDGSTDLTEQIALQFAQQDNRIKIISNKTNLKLPAALNVGFENAKGDYFTWTSDDNQYKPNAIKVMVEFLETNNIYDLVYCDYDCINERGEYLQTYLMENEENLLEMVEGYGIGACFLYTKKLANDIGKYNESTFCAEDQDFFCRAVLNAKIKHLHENLYIYLQNSQNLTATKKDIIPQVIKEVQLKYAIPIMEKLNFSNYQITKTLMSYYKDKNQIEWFILAKSLNPFLAYYYFYKPDIQRIFLELSFYFCILQALFNKKKIMFWGASIFLKNFLKKYNLKNQNILGIIDKDEKKQGQYLFNYKIYAPDDIKNLCPDFIIFSIKNNHKKIYTDVFKYLDKYHSKILLSKNYFTYLTSKTNNKKRLTKNKWHDIYDSNLSKQILIDIKNKKYNCQTNEILKLVEKNSTSLEIGCGSAMSSLILAKEKNVNATVLDYSQETLEQVEKNAKKLNLNIKAYCCDAFKESPFTEKFDYIFHSGLLEHFHEKERIKFLKLWKPYCKTMISMVPNAASIAYRTGKACMEKNNSWPYGLEMPLYTQIPDFIEAGYKVKNEYTIGMQEALSFLEENNELKNIISDWYNSNCTEDDCHQGYLLITIGENTEQ